MFTGQTKYEQLFKKHPSFIARRKGFHYVNEPEIAQYFNALIWCRDNLPEKAKIVSSQQRSSYFLSGRMCYNPARVGGRNNADRFMKRILSLGIEYIVLDDVYDESIKITKPAVEKYKRCLELIHETSSPVALVYRVDSSCVRYNLEHGYMDEIDKTKDDIMSLIGLDNVEAIDSSIEMIREDADSVGNYIDYIKYLFGSFQYNRAETLMMVADIVHPNNGYLWQNWGTLNLKIALDPIIQTDAVKRLSVAENSFRRALQFGADSSDCYNNLGAIFQMRNNIDSSLVYYEKSFEMTPYDFNKLGNIIRILSIQEDWDAINRYSLRIRNSDYYNESFKAKFEQLLVDVRDQY
jgi:tetratricopeptide (TPR) repeat protein